MDSKLLIIIATGEKEKALTGLMYARNAIGREWLGDIKVVFFGPIERLMVNDEDVASMVKEVAAIGGGVACKFISDRDAVSEGIEKLGVDVEYVGPLISDMINDGYVPMVW